MVTSRKHFRLFRSRRCRPLPKRPFALPEFYAEAQDDTIDVGEISGNLCHVMDFAIR